MTQDRVHRTQETGHSQRINVTNKHNLILHQKKQMRIINFVHLIQAFHFIYSDTTFTLLNSILTQLTNDNKSKSDFHTLFLCTFDYHDKRKLGSGPDQLIVIHKIK